jgi:hypothetical protein
MRVAWTWSRERLRNIQITRHTRATQGEVPHDMIGRRVNQKQFMLAKALLDKGRPSTRERTDLGVVLGGRDHGNVRTLLAEISTDRELVVSHHQKEGRGRCSRNKNLKAVLTNLLSEESCPNPLESI